MSEKKSETSIIQGLGQHNKLTVQKSLPLLGLWKSDLTLNEFKILDIYLSRINSYDPEHRIVELTKGEFESIMGVKRIHKSDLRVRLKHLMSGTVEIPDLSEKEGFRVISLFEEASARLDDDGLWIIKLECTQKAMKYIFNIENIGYLRYKLRCVINIESKYSYLMFLYLEHNRFRKTWEIEVDKLKRYLNCDGIKAYEQFKDFNRLILKRVYKELNDKTECKYDYESIKVGRFIKKIRFTLKKSAEDDAENLLSANDTIDVIDTRCDMVQDMDNPNSYYTHPDDEYFSDELTEELLILQAKRELWFSALTFHITEEEYREMRALLVGVPDYKLPNVMYDAREINMYHYIDQKVRELMRRDKVSPISKKYLYLLTMVKNDLKDV